MGEKGAEVQKKNERRILIMVNAMKWSWLEKSGIVYLLLGLTAGLLFCTLNIIGFDFEYFPGDIGDGRLNLYFLEHAHKFFTGQVSSFWNAPFMYPEAKVIAYSDNLLGSAPIYSFFRIIGFDIYASYQWWFIMVSAFNYISAFYFLKYIVKSNQAAVLGAFIFAFSIALQSQLTHAQTFPRFAIPLAFLFAAKFSKELNPKYLFFTILSVVYQIYCGIYLGFMLVVPVGIYLVFIFLKDRLYDKAVTFDRKWYIKSGAYVIANVLILMPLMLPYMGRNIGPTFRHYMRISHSIPTLKSYFYSQEGSLVWDFLSTSGREYQAWWDHQIFTGAIASICFLIALYWLISKLIRTKLNLSKLPNIFTIFLSGLVTFFLYLRFKGVSAYIFLYFVPGFSSMRSMTRIINIELIFFALATAFIYVSLFKKKLKPIFQIPIFLLVLALLVGDNYFFGNRSYKTVVNSAKERTLGIEKVYATIPAGSLVSYEPIGENTGGAYTQIDGMLSAQKFNHKSVNGYTATSPRDFNSYWKNPSEESRNYWLADKDLLEDTLYVVDETGIVGRIDPKTLKNSLEAVSKEADKLQRMIRNIKKDEKWMSLIEEKALTRGISMDSMVVLDAIWMLENEE